MKNITAFLFTYILAATIFAQQNKFNIGIEGGPSSIHLWGNAVGEFINHPGIGFSGGLIFQYNFPKMLSLRTGLSFERKGALTSDINMTDDAGNFLGVTQDRFNFDYITLPLLLRANFGKKVNFFVNAGAFLGYLVKVNYIPKESFGTPVNKSINLSSEYRTFDTGLTAGVGLAVPVKKLIFSIELRNNTGLYNIEKPANNNHLVLKTSSTSLLIGIAYKFGTIIEGAK